MGRMLVVGTRQGQQTWRLRQGFVPSIECLIELLIEYPHLEQLDVREFQDGSHIIHLLAEQPRGMPVNYRRIFTPKRDAAGEGVAYLLIRKGGAFSAQDAGQ